MARQYLIPGEIFLTESGTSQYLVGTSVEVNETTALGGATTLGPGLAALHYASFAPTGTVVTLGVQVSKANAYAVLSPLPGINVSKANAYAVLSPLPGINVSKANVYAVVFAGLQLSPGIAALHHTTFAPTFQITRTLAVGKTSLSITGKAPTLSVTTATILTVGKASLTITGKAPSLTTILQPGARHLSIQGQQLTLTLTLRPLPAALRIQDQTPALHMTTPLGVGTAALRITGLAPSLTYAYGPAAAALTITGMRPVMLVSHVIGTVVTAELLGNVDIGDSLIGGRVTIGDELNGNVTLGRIPE